jgi:acetyl-CoA acetyltransferase family protein
LADFRDAVILEGARTPFCRAGTIFARVSARELGRVAVREAIERSEVACHDVDEVIVGSAAGCRETSNIARVIALSAGVPRRVPAFTVNRSCGSALQAIAEAVLRIRSGEADVVVAAGTESATQTGPGVPETGLVDPISGLTMGAAAEILAREFGVTREEQDALALLSHQRSARARAEGRFGEEIVPVPLPPAFDRLADRDEGPREDQSIEALAKLPPRYEAEYGTVTAGNSCAPADGAAAVVLSTREKARVMGARPIGRVRAVAFAACEPERTGLAPIYAAALALRRAGATLGDVGLVEMHESFASQVIASLRAMASADFARDNLGQAAPLGTLDLDRTNVNGGAIAIGHPAGASGARLVLTLLREMRRRNVPLGLATISIDGGQGGAIVVEAT